MGYTTGQVAAGFGKTSQTIRDWIKNPHLQEFFSPSARRDSGRGQAELFASDVEVCNSIASLLGQGLDWEHIATELKKGWRDTGLPDKFLVLDDDPRSPSNVMLMAKLAAAQETINADARVEQMLREQITELKEELAENKRRRQDDDKKNEELLKRLFKAEVQLELWESGRLTHAVAPRADASMSGNANEGRG